MSGSSAYTEKHIKNREIAAYAVAGGGQNFCYALITGYILYFYVNVFGVDSRVVGIMLLAEGIWDIVNNPLAGILIDRTRTKHGKMIPYLRWGTAPLTVLTMLLFTGPFIIHDTSPFSPAKIAYMFLTYFLWEIVYTLTDVSFWGLSAAITPNPDDRSRVMKFTNISITVMSALPHIAVPLLLDYANAGGSGLNLKNTFLLLGFLASFGMAMMAFAGFAAKERVAQSGERYKIKESVLGIIRNPALRLLMLTNLIFCVEGAGRALGIYYYIDVLGSASLSILSQIPAAMTWMVSYRFLGCLKRRLDGRGILLTAYISYGLIWLTIYIVSVKYYNISAVMVPLIMAAQAYSGLLGAPATIVFNEMIADCVDYTEWKTGKRNEGVSFSMKTAVQKAGSTISQSAASALLSAIGYKASGDGVRVRQTVLVQKRLSTATFLSPAAGFLLASVPLFFYKLTGEERRKMLSELKERRIRNY